MTGHWRDGDAEKRDRVRHMHKRRTLKAESHRKASEHLKPTLCSHIFAAQGDNFNIKNEKTKCSYTLDHFASFQRQYIKVTTCTSFFFSIILYLNVISVSTGLPQSNILFYFIFCSLSLHIGAEVKIERTTGKESLQHQTHDVYDLFMSHQTESVMFQVS